MSSDVVWLNVGGFHFVTRRTTLETSDSFFSGLVAADAHADEYFIDRDPTVFRHVLNWMRGVKHVPDDDLVLQELVHEAEYYSLSSLVAAIRTKRPRCSISKALEAIADEMRQKG